VINPHICIGLFYVVRHFRTALFSYGYGIVRIGLMVRKGLAGAGKMQKSTGRVINIPGRIAVSELGSVMFSRAA
jgi:hypothetical protein